jgi:hypothetical protein
MDSMTSKSATPPSDATTVTSLLLWAREKGIAISELQVGAIRITCLDMKLAAANVRAPDKEDAANLYRQYGGDLFERAGTDLLETIIEDDDEEGDETPSRPRGGRPGGGRTARASRRR